MKKIPHSQPTIGEKEALAAAEIVRSGKLADGAQCRLFEEEIAQKIGRKYAVVISSGHSALELWLESIEGDKDEVIRIPSYCCAALRHGLQRKSQKFLIEDVEWETCGLSPGEGKAIAVNMFSVPCREVTYQSLEDCAMGFIPGVTGVRTHAALLSFYVTKMLTTGQGGALVTDDKNLYQRWCELLQYDNQENYYETTNRSMTDMQAAIGRVQLSQYDEFLERRKELFCQYKEKLDQYGLALHPVVERAVDHILFRLPLYVPDGHLDSLQDHLDQHGIEAKRPVFKPLHRDVSSDSKDFPHSEKLDQTVLSLPFYPTLKKDEVVYIVETIACYFKSV